MSRAECQKGEGHTEKCGETWREVGGGGSLQSSPGHQLAHVSEQATCNQKEPTEKKQDNRHCSSHSSRKKYVHSQQPDQGTLWHRDHRAELLEECRLSRRATLAPDKTGVLN